MDLSAFNLQGKVALITGGAHGIGFSIAEGMAKCGAVICFNCSSEASLEKGMAAYKAAGIDAHGYVADVSDENAVNAMVAKIKAEVGPVDILVNNAGLMKRVPMVEMSHADFRRCLQLLQGRSAGHDGKARGQDHQHLLHDERAGPRDRFRLRRRQGCAEDADQEHRL